MKLDHRCESLPRYIPTSAERELWFFDLDFHVDGFDCNQYAVSNYQLLEDQAPGRRNREAVPAGDGTMCPRAAEQNGCEVGIRRIPFRNTLQHALLCVALLGASATGAYAANDQWIEMSSSHFKVITNSNEKQARVIIDQFERMRWMFQILFPKVEVDPAAPIVVVAAKNQKTFQSLEPAAYLAKGQLQLAGYFMTNQDKNYVLLRLDGEQEHPFSTVYHEYTHLQFRDAKDWMPLWLNEGLAEFMQNTEFRNKDVNLGVASIGDIEYLQQNRIIPLPVLFSVDHNSPYYHEEQKGSVFYAESWALTHYLFVSDK